MAPVIAATAQGARSFHRALINRLETVMIRRFRGSMARATLIALAVLVAAAPDARAQWSTTYEQFYLQAPHNWTFRDRYQAADRLFNAFDYGHAILYETLWTKPNAPASALEVKEYDFLTKKVLVKPPRVPLEEAAIEIAYAQLAPEAKMMFEWAHILHRQIYDVLADERLSDARKDAEVARLLAYYRTRKDLAFSSKPKSMELMQEQPYSLAFRERYPKFNGLIWGYHWLQVGLYEPLLVNATPETRQSGVRATVARFWQMLDDAPKHMPYQMPMTSAVAPTFAARYPEAAIIFDNLHSMHDVISDILANPGVPRDRKRAEILRAARLYADDTSYVMSVEAWLTMSREMGIENMGGPSVGFLSALPTPTVTYGAVMEHDEQTGKMVGMKVGQMTGAMAGMDHSTPSSTGAARDSMAGMDHSRMNMPGARDTSQKAVDHAAMGHGTGVAAPGADTAMMPSMMAMHMRMLADTGIRRHLLADTILRRMTVEMLPMMAGDHRADIEEMLRDTLPAPAARRSTPARRATTRPAARPGTKPATPAVAKPAAKPAAPPAAKPDEHAGHTMPPPAKAPPPKPKPVPPPAETIVG